MTKEKGTCSNVVWNVIIVILLVVNLVFSALIYTGGSDKMYQLEILKVGGQENFDQMMELYESKEFQDYASKAQKESLNQFKTMIATQDTTPTLGEDDIDVDVIQDNTGTATPDVADTAKVAAIIADGVIKGNANAPITILEYADMNCGYCKRQIAQEKTLDQILEKYGDQVNVVYRNMPVLGSIAQGQAIECVREIDPTKYYDFIVAGYASQDTSEAALKTIAKDLKIDEAKFATCLADQTTLQRVNDQLAEGSNLWKISGTPASVVINPANGEYKLIEGAYPVSEFEAAINALLTNQ